MTRFAAIGTAKGLFLVDDGKALQGPLFPGERVPAVALAPDGRMVVASVSEWFGPTVRFSEDFGATWTEPDERAIAFPPGLEWTNHFTNETKPAAVVQVWQLRFAGNGVVYAGTEPAALFRSDDGGRSFELNRPLWDHPHRPQWWPGGGGLGLHTILVDPNDSDRLLIAISSGGVYRSDDGGKSWEARNTGIAAPAGPDEPVEYPEFGQCVHKVDRDATNSDTFYLQNHGGLYRSENRGDTWESIAKGVPSDFGFPMVANPRRPGTAYIIPLDFMLGRCVPEGKCRVYRTTDGGGSWKPLRKGLPQKNAFMTVLRDAFCADDGDPVGLWFGTRSGHVFHSGDEGESWKKAAEYLPDVLCVRAVAR